MPTPHTHQQLHAAWLVRRAGELPGISDISTCNGATCPAGSGWLASGVERLGLWVWVFFSSRTGALGPGLAVHLEGGRLTPLSSPRAVLRPHRPAIKVALLGKRGLSLGRLALENPSEPAAASFALEVVVRFGWAMKRKSEGFYDKPGSVRAGKQLLILRCDCVSLLFPAFSLAYMYVSVYRGRRKIDHFLTQPCRG